MYRALYIPISLDLVCEHREHQITEPAHVYLPNSPKAFADTRSERIYPEMMECIEEKKTHTIPAGRH